MKRFIAWLVCVAALVGLGALIHAGMPPTPRWTTAVTSPEGEWSFSAHFASGTVLLWWKHRVGTSSTQSHLTVIDVETGRARPFLGAEVQLSDPALSRTGRVAAVTDRPGEQRLLVLDPSWADVRAYHLPRGDFLSPWLPDDGSVVLVTERAGAPLHAFDAESGRLLYGIPDNTPKGWTRVRDGVLLHQTGPEELLTVRDLRTGRHRVTFPYVNRHLGPPQLTAAGLLVAHGGGTTLWDLGGPAPREVLTVPARYRHTSTLSEDGRVLIVCPSRVEGFFPAQAWDVAWRR